MSMKNRHKTFVWKYFDRGISKSSNGVTDKAKCNKCAATIKCTGGSTSALFRHLKNKHSMEKPGSTQSDVSSNTQSASSTKRVKSAYSQATLHSFMNRKTREEIVAKHVAVDGSPPSVVCNSEFICLAFSDNIAFKKKQPNHAMQLEYKQYEISKMLIWWKCNNIWRVERGSVCY